MPSTRVPPHILIVDDEPLTLELVVEKLASTGFDATVVASAEEAFQVAGIRSFDVVVTDLSMPGTSGMEVLAHFSETYPEISVIVLTGMGTVESAVEAMKRGAFDYLSKPTKTDELILSIERALELRALKTENILLRTQVQEQHRFERLIGQSAPMQALYRIIKRVAKTDSTVLIMGESGTGKELIANAVHSCSERRDKPFVPINCGAIPEELLESELFGHDKGAFTGAFKDRRGRFELAHTGTIFLDEIGEMSPKLQVKLLRFLQERKFQRIGGTRTIEVDVRIIAATNKDLEKAVATGEFREDLFYRLNVIPIQVIPLREREGDIPLLVDHFILQHCTHKEIPLKHVSRQTLEYLKNYRWPGNVRELENAVERIVILCEDDEIKPDDLPERMQVCRPVVEEVTAALPEIGEEGINLKDMLEELESRLIMEALRKAEGVKNKAAKLLGLNRTTLIEKMKKKKITFPSESS